MNETVSKPVIRVEFLGYPDETGIQFTGLSVTANPALLDAATLAAVLPKVFESALEQVREGNFLDLTELG